MSSHKASFKVIHPGRTVVHVLVDSTEEGLADMLDKEVAKVIRSGRTVSHPDGSIEWIAVGEDCDPNTFRVIWHPDGNRVRWTRTHVKIEADGTRTETPLRPTWRRPEGL